MSREETSNAEHYVNEHHRDEAAGCGKLGLAIGRNRRCEVRGHGNLLSGLAEVPEGLVSVHAVPYVRTLRGPTVTVCETLHAR
jgi:hypothetical protein